jgi:hypothetical protein
MDSLLQTAQIPVAQAQMYMQQRPYAQQLQAPVALAAPAPLECEAPAVECVNAACMGDVGCSEEQDGVEVCGCQAPPPPPPPPVIVVGSQEWQEKPENQFEAPGTPPPRTLALSQSIWSHQFGGTGLFPAPKLTPTTHPACQLSNSQPTRLRCTSCWISPFPRTAI